mmetsp:Transcript_86942/g.270436  ORF Transcript_86942/g.270436 Transcript_86942/m.270436 type:complete len:343 (-) Transcript_86942:3-1031(-)
MRRCGRSAKSKKLEKATRGLPTASRPGRSSGGWELGGLVEADAGLAQAAHRGPEGPGLHDAADGLDVVQAESQGEAAVLTADENAAGVGLLVLEQVPAVLDPVELAEAVGAVGKLRRRLVRDELVYFPVREPAGLLQNRDSLLEVGVGRDPHLHQLASQACVGELVVLGVVDQRPADDSAVRDVDALIEERRDPHVEEINVRDGAGEAADLDEVAYLEGPGKHELHPRGQVGERVLRGEAEDHRARGQQVAPEVPDGQAGGLPHRAADHDRPGELDEAECESDIGCVQVPVLEGRGGHLVCLDRSGDGHQSHGDVHRPHARILRGSPTGNQRPNRCRRAKTA